MDSYKKTTLLGIARTFWKGLRTLKEILRGLRRLQCDYLKQLVVACPAHRNDQYEDRRRR